MLFLNFMIFCIKVTSQWSQTLHFKSLFRPFCRISDAFRCSLKRSSAIWQWSLVDSAIKNRNPPSATSRAKISISRGKNNGTGNFQFSTRKIELDISFLDKKEKKTKKKPLIKKCPRGIEKKADFLADNRRLFLRRIDVHGRLKT